MPRTKAKVRSLDKVEDAEHDEYDDARSKIWLGRKRFNGHDPADSRDPAREPLEAGS